MDFWRFQPITDGRLPINGEFTLLIVALSLIVSILASYGGITALERARASDSRKLKDNWMLLGAFVLGIGVWGMHFTGMLAFMLPVPMSYNAGITVASMLPAIIGSFFTLKQLNSDRLSWRRIQLAALCFASGVGTMHYTGMEAMAIDVDLVYSPKLFLLSIAVAHGLATFAIYIGAITQQGNRRRAPKALAASAMGFAIAGMHYTGMASASFYPTSATFLGNHQMTVDGLTLSLATTAITTLLVGLLIVSAIFDRRLQSVVTDLADKSRREQSIVDNLLDGIIVIDSEDHIDTFNRAFLKLCQYSESSIKSVSISTLLPAINYDTLIADSQQEETAFINKTSRIELIKKDGNTIFCEATIALLTLNTHIMFNASFRDISKREALELKLAHAQKLESIGQLAAGIAHEINTPTQYIAGNISFLKGAFHGCIDSLEHSRQFCHSRSEKDLQRLQKSLSSLNFDFMVSQIPQAIDQSLEGLDRVSTIVKAMKSFSHPSHGAKHLVDLGEAISTTVTVARNEWRYVADLHLDIDPELPSIDGLRDEINQVLLNMIVNAAHSIEERHRHDEEKGAIEIAAHFDQQYCYIDIKDDGMGISENHKTKIFDPFFTTKEVGRGTGQGLSIAYSVITEKHAGEILVQSSLGRGATFTIKLPRYEEGSTTCTLPQQTSPKLHSAIPARPS